MRYMHTVDTWLHGYMATWLHGHMATWLHGYMATWQHGNMYMATWLLKATWLHGYMRYIATLSQMSGVFPR